MKKSQDERRKAKGSGLAGFYICLVTCLLPVLSSANQFGAKIKTAELTLQGDYYVLSANLVYRLSEPAKEALQNGVPLYWNIAIKVMQQRAYFFDKTLVEKTLRYRIQYHALLNMYRVRNESTGSADNFSTLSAALDMIAMMHNIRVIEKKALASENGYYVGMKITFDREALPLPLRPAAYLNSQWYLSSSWYLWPLTK